MIIIFFLPQRGQFGQLCGFSGVFHHLNLDMAESDLVPRNNSVTLDAALLQDMVWHTVIDPWQTTGTSNGCVQ